MPVPAWVGCQGEDVLRKTSCMPVPCRCHGWDAKGRMSSGRPPACRCQHGEGCQGEDVLRKTSCMPVPAWVGCQGEDVLRKTSCMPVPAWVGCQGEDILPAGDVCLGQELNNGGIVNTLALLCDCSSPLGMTAPHAAQLGHGPSGDCCGYWPRPAAGRQARATEASGFAKRQKCLPGNTNFFVKVQALDQHKGHTLGAGNALGVPPLPPKQAAAGGNVGWVCDPRELSSPPPATPPNTCQPQPGGGFGGWLTLCINVTPPNHATCLQRRLLPVHDVQDSVVAFLNPPPGGLQAPCLSFSMFHQPFAKCGWVQGTASLAAPGAICHKHEALAQQQAGYWFAEWRSDQVSQEPAG